MDAPAGGHLEPAGDRGADPFPTNDASWGGFPGFSILPEKKPHEAIATLESELTEARTLYMEINSLETQLIGMRNQRDALNLSIWDKIKRVRTGMKSIFGDDSSEYEMVGGTRMSDRKHPTRQEEPAA